MAHAEICPVCVGRGVVVEDGEEVLCYGCEGLGWVTVYDFDREEEVQYAMFPVKSLRAH